MTASEQVVEALRARAAELAPVSRSLANKREREYCTALADFVEAADKLRAHVDAVLKYDLDIGGDPWCEPALQDEHKGHDDDLTGLGLRYDAALKRLAEVLR